MLWNFNPNRKPNWLHGTTLEHFEGSEPRISGLLGHCQVRVDTRSDSLPVFIVIVFLCGVEFVSVLTFRWCSYLCSTLVERLQSTSGYHLLWVFSFCELICSLPDFYLLREDNEDNAVKRRLLLGRKAMTNLGSILKSRDITLLTNVHLVKATVFPVVIIDVRAGL